MTFIKEKGRHEAVTSDGKIIHFEDAAEMKACAELRDSLLVLVGREPENAALFMQSSECRVQSEAPQSKNVLIRIDTEAEYVGKEKAFA